MTPSKYLRDSLESLSNMLDVKENITFLKNVIPIKSLYEKKN